MIMMMMMKKMITVVHRPTVDGEDKEDTAVGQCAFLSPLRWSSHRRSSSSSTFHCSLLLLPSPRDTEKERDSVSQFLFRTISWSVGVSGFLATSEASLALAACTPLHVLFPRCPFVRFLAPSSPSSFSSPSFYLDHFHNKTCWGWQICLSFWDNSWTAASAAVFPDYLMLAIRFRRGIFSRRPEKKVSIFEALYCGVGVLNTNSLLLIANRISFTFEAPAIGIDELSIFSLISFTADYSPRLYHW